MDKRTLRQHYLSRRLALEPAVLAAHNQQILTTLLQSDCFQRAKRIGLYMPIKQEFDLLPLLSLAPEKHYFLPKITLAQDLQFCAYDEKTPLSLNRFNILEVADAKGFACDVLDLLCIPLVAFNRQGFRLGMGGGYYDRTLAQAMQIKPFLLGLAHAWQENADFKVEKHDKPLNAIITEREYIICTGY